MTKCGLEMHGIFKEINVHLYFLTESLINIELI